MTETTDRPQLDAKDIYSAPYTGRAYYDVDPATVVVDISE